MPVYFALVFSGREVADMAADALRAEGYEVGFQDQVHDGSVVVTASPTTALSEDEVAGLNAGASLGAYAAGVKKSMSSWLTRSASS